MKRPKRIVCVFCKQETSKQVIQKHWSKCLDAPDIGNHSHICSICQTPKPLERFSPCPGNPGGFMHTCKDCALIQHNHWRRLNNDRKAPPFGEVKLRPGAWKLRPCRYCGALFNFRGMHAHVRVCDGSNKNRIKRPIDPFLPDMEKILNDHLVKDKKRETRSRNLWKAYGITAEDYDRILIEQGETCGICHSNKTEKGFFCVDHCHTTGKVRGLICGPCNRGMGQFMDNEDTLIAAAEYILKSRELKTGFHFPS